MQQRLGQSVSRAMQRGYAPISGGIYIRQYAPRSAASRSASSTADPGASCSMPAEWTRHKQCWMGWPSNEDNWRDKALPAQDAFVKVASAIAQFEPVVVCANRDQVATARARLPAHIAVKELEFEASWFRDNAPTFVIGKSGGLAGVDWRWNAYGNLYKPVHDQEVASRICGFEGVPVRPSNIVLEGGSIHVDGEGTLITTGECLLNTNRNPDLSREQIEAELKQQLGVRKIIWIPRGIVNDETSGHVDNMAVFTKPGHVLLAWTDDTSDPQHERCAEALAILATSRDAAGRLLNITKLPLPPVQHYSQQEYDALSEGAKAHYSAGQRLAASYINFYLPNGGVVAPSFGHEASDSHAAAILAQAFPDRKVVMVASREILLGGGNIHCITQQQPQPV